EVCPAEVCPAEVRMVEPRPAEVRPAEVRPAEVWTDGVPAMPLVPGGHALLEHRAVLVVRHRSSCADSAPLLLALQLHRRCGQCLLRLAQFRLPPSLLEFFRLSFRRGDDILRECCE